MTRHQRNQTIRFWRGGFDSHYIARRVNLSEPDILRVIHASMERRRRRVRLAA
jgi:plasmid stabilization system protein ParE